MTDTGATNHTAGVIESVFGTADGRGIPELSRAKLRLYDGSTLEARMPGPIGDETTFRALPVVFEFIDLGICPICLTPGPTSRERDLPRSQRLQLSPLIESIHIARSAAEPTPGEIVLMVRADAGEDSARFVISFNRVFAVGWPLEPITGFHAMERPS